MKCFCDRNFTPVAGVGQWDWGAFAQDVVKAGLQVGTSYAASEFGNGSGGSATPINPSLPYYPYQQAPVVQQPPQSATPDWLWPVLIAGGGLIVVVLLVKLR